MGRGGQWAGARVLVRICAVECTEFWLVSILNWKRHTLPSMMHFAFIQNNWPLFFSILPIVRHYCVVAGGQFDHRLQLHALPMVQRFAQWRARAISARCQRCLSELPVLLYPRPGASCLLFWALYRSIHVLTHPPISTYTFIRLYDAPIRFWNTREFPEIVPVFESPFHIFLDTSFLSLLRGGVIRWI